MADSVSQAAEQLYALPPAEFTVARDELARQARTAGQRDAAGQIKKLARPTVSAWLVNQLVRASPEQMSRLFEVGQSLHAAQRELAGDRLRELSAARRKAIAELMPEASRLAAESGVGISGGALDEVRATLEAALADTGARAAVRSGQLTRALTYAGLGEVDLSAALAAVPARTGRAAAAGRRSAAGSAEAGSAEAGRPAAEVARGAVQAAEEAVAAAAQDLAAAESRTLSLAEQRQFLSRRIAHLGHELERAEAEDRDLARAARDAKRDQDGAARALARSERQLGRARERAGSS